MNAQYNIRLWHDALIPGAELEITTPGASRILFMLDGNATINGAELPAGKAIMVHGLTQIFSNFKPATIIRYELLEDLGDKPHIISNGATNTEMAHWQWVLPAEYNMVQLDIVTMLNHQYNESDSPNARHLYIYEGAGHCNGEPFKSPLFVNLQGDSLAIKPQAHRQLWAFLLQISDDYSKQPIISDKIARINLLTTRMELL